VVDKEVAVREEIVMRRSANEHVEVIHDSVCKTEVEVERFGADGGTISRK
jgi:stress response protein YsnF